MSIQSDSEWEDYDPSKFDSGAAAPVAVVAPPPSQSESDFDINGRFENKLVAPATLCVGDLLLPFVSLSLREHTCATSNKLTPPSPISVVLSMLFVLGHLPFFRAERLHHFATLATPFHHRTRK
jgi:hypothetical protein